MYGQKNYNEIQGINGKYRINQIGCFLVSFCNLLERFGKGVDPLTLNRIFRDNGIYVDVDDGIRDDLAYSSVTRANGNVVVTRTGTGLPPSNNCIVKFTGLSGFGTHFCLVKDAARGIIIDSWDGKEKHWSTYNNPDVWAEYADRSPAPAPKPAPTPAPSVPADHLKVEAGWGLSHVAKAAGYEDWREESRWDYLARINGHADRHSFRLSPNQIVRVRGADPAATPAPAPQKPVEAPQQPEIVNISVQPGWGITHVLKAAGYLEQQYKNEKEWDRTAALNGSATRLRFKPNDVIKVYRNPLPQEAPAPAPVPAPVVEAPQAVAPVVDPPKQAEEAKKEVEENADGSVTVPVTVVPKDPKAYQKTLVPEDKIYIAATSKTIHDIDGLHMDLQLVAGQKVTSGGRFTKEDENGKVVEYVITKKHLTDGKWYGIPADFLGAAKDPNAYVGPLVNDEDDDDLFDLDLAVELRDAIGLTSKREKFLDFLGKLYDALMKLKFWNKNKS